MGLEVVIDFVFTRVSCIKSVAIRMPEYMSHERDRVEDFERNAPALPS